MDRKILCVSKSFSYQKSAKFKVSRETDKNAPHWVCSFAVFDCLQAFCRAFGKLLNKQRFTPIFIWLFGKYKLNQKIQMTHNHIYLQNLLNLLGFEHKISTIYSKTYAQHQHYTITVNFETEKIAYPEPINLGDKTTSHFEASENFVVLECVNRLLEQGYKPENITLEKKWGLGHKTKGKVDVFVQYPENYLPNTEKNGKAFLLIECKTWGKEFDGEFEKTLDNGGQLLSYFQQEQSTEFLVLYASVLENGKLTYTNRIIEVKDEFKGKNKAEVFKYWKDELGQIFKYNGIFSDEFEKIEPYNIELKPLKKKDLAQLRQTDSGYIYNQFAEILRHNVVSDKPNAFNKMFNLILAKIYDEDKGVNEELEFQILENDTDIDLQKRINDLYKKAMLEYLDKTVTDFSDDDLGDILKDNTLSKEVKKQLQNRITALRLHKNNEFAFKEVFNEKSFNENAGVVREVVSLLQSYQLRYSHKQQFLSNFFELLLSNTLKQESGQFFTPVPVAKFIIACMPLQELVEKNIEEKKNQFLPYCIDYACGSGHFITEIMDEIQHIIVKLDTKNCKPSIKSEIQTWKTEGQAYKWAKEYIYGIEKDYRLSKIAKVSCFLNGDGLANIIHADGLESFESEEFVDSPKLRNDKNKAAKQEKDNPNFDIIVANPPYSVSAFIKTLPKHSENFTLSTQFTENSKEIEILFIERTKQLTKENGFVGIILPSSLLNGGVYESARAMILQYFRIVAIVEFGSGTFMATGTNTITLFLQRRNNNEITQLNNQINKIFAEKNLLGFEKQASLEAYITHTHNVSAADYLTFVNQNTNEVFAATELYQNYVKWYEKLTETVNLKDKITKLETNLLKLKVSLSKSTEQEAEKTRIKITEIEAELTKAKADLIRKFYEKLTEQEKEKMTYFFLAYEQKTILVKTNPKGNNDAEKEFLGYEFSNRRGHEGIRMFTDAENQPTTKLYHETNRQDFTKVSSYIYQAFLGLNEKNLEGLAAENGLSENLQIQNLYEMMNFESISFDKAIAVNFIKKTDIEFESKFVKKKLIDLVDYKQGIIFNKNDQSVTETQNKIFTASNINLENLSLDFSELIYLKPDIEIDKSLFLRKNDIFICTSSGSISHLGKSVFIDKDLDIAFGGFCGVLRTQNYITAKYIYLILNTEKFRNFIFIQKGSNINNLSRENLLNLKIPLPDFSVQQQIIAEIEPIEQQETAQKERKEVLKSEIENVVNKAFSKEFDFVKLGAITEIISGGTPKTTEKSYWNGGKIFWATLVDTKQKYLYKTERKITELGLQNSSATLLPINTVIFSSRATIGDITIAKVPTSTNQGYKSFICNAEKIHYEFLYYVLKKEAKNIESISSGMTYAEISKSQISEYKIPLPSLAIQTQILAKIAILETELTKITKFLDTVKAMKETVLQKYL